MLERISKSNREKEGSIQQSIRDAIDKAESIIFNSGAGAGKTYALIESLKYVILKYGEILEKHNQKILCITYTNVAADEVKGRLGNSELVLVSTIHTRLWEIIEKHQRELVEIHKEKLILEISSQIARLEENNYIFDAYRNLKEEQKSKFKKIMVENKDLFRKNYYVQLKELNNVFRPLLNILSIDTIKSKERGNFIKLLNILYSIDEYNKCLDNIQKRKKGFNSVNYDFLNGKERLHEMKISHDTVLEYAQQLVTKYDLLKQIIIDKYPYIFIDEYQDTDKNVVLIMNDLHKYAEKINRNFFIGYFGDTAQNIYEKGIGSKIKDVHPGLKVIKKDFNRRSTQEIINVANKIRNDEIEQVSIYEDCKGGSVQFFTGREEEVDNFINKSVEEWGLKEGKDHIHCLVLTNRIITKYCGFENIYKVFSKTKKYGGNNYSLLNTELLGKELTKLGEIPLVLFYLINLRENINNINTTIINLSPNRELFQNMNFTDLKYLIGLLNKMEGSNLEQFLESIFKIYSDDEKGHFRKMIDTIFRFGNFSIDLFKSSLMEKLYYNLTNEELDKANVNIQRLLDISIEEYLSWYKFVADKQEDLVVYHTYHGTKGIEFDSVIIIMGNSFGTKNKEYFDFFFKNYPNPETLEEKDKIKFEKVRNLLYVSCSRAIKNLRIFYVDDITDFKNEVEIIFGKTIPFTS